MKYSQAQAGRIYIIRLEHGDILHESIEEFAKEQNISHAALLVLGGADRSSRLVTGPEDGLASPVKPMYESLSDVSEVCGTGTIAPDESGKPVLHMHIACGRNRDTVTGCVRAGVRVWHVMEVVLFEIVGSGATRRFDPATGFALLEP